jgi:hypothetical protein
MEENRIFNSELRSVAKERLAASNGKAVSWAQADRVVRAFAEERPFAAIGFALASGYLIGRAINATR